MARKTENKKMGRPCARKAEITQKLRDDCIMILDEAGAWPGEAAAAPHTWGEKKSAMTKIMEDEAACKDLIARISRIAADDEAKKKFSDSFFKSTAKLLQYRIDAGDLTVDPEEGGAEEASWNSGINMAAHALRKYNQSVVGYKLVQQLGEGRLDMILGKVSESLAAQYGEHVTLRAEKTPIPGMDFMEKTTYMGRTVWLVEPSLPVYVITKDETSGGAEESERGGTEM